MGRGEVCDLPTWRGASQGTPLSCLQHQNSEAALISIAVLADFKESKLLVPLGSLHGWCVASL